MGSGIAGRTVSVSTSPTESQRRINVYIPLDSRSVILNIPRPGRAPATRYLQRVVVDKAENPQDLRDIDLVALYEALEALAALDAQQMRIVELRFFGGLTVEDVEHVLGVSKRKIEGDWTHAKAWLRSALDPGNQP